MSLDRQSLRSVPWTRREFMQLSAASALSIGALKFAEAEEASTRRTMMDIAFDRREPRVALIGAGRRGSSLLENLLAAGAQVAAICDILPENAGHAAAMVVRASQKKPELYTDGPHSYETLLATNDVDLVLVATPWRWHASMAVAAMKHGKDVAIEVPGVVTLDECWAIVKTSEETRKHCMMLENCCYGYNETLILRMVHQGMFGELLYGEGAYLHDLRTLLFTDSGPGLWRRTEHTLSNGNLYPTHGLGPVANYMGIQRGDRFATIVSMSSPQRGLDLYRKQNLKPGDPRCAEHYVTGDMNTSLIQTAKGLTITVKHTVTTPHPYSRINLIAGTKGIFEDYPPRIYFDGMNKEEEWGLIDAFKQYQHPLWMREGQSAQKMDSHGGMDYIMLYRLLECVRKGLQPDIDVYDAAAWAAVGPQSAASVSRGSAPVEFPDFTRGKWRQRSVSAIATQA